MEISTDPERLDLNVIHRFLETSYWAKGRRRSVVERAIKNSLCFGVYENGRQVAFARVVSDRPLAEPGNWMAVHDPDSDQRAS